MSLTFVLIASLDLIKASTSPDLLRYTISEYGLGPQRAPFTAAVLLLAAGSLTTLGVLIRQGTTRLRSGASAALVLWALGLSVIAIFPKRDRSAVADTISGEIHRIASLVAPPVR